MKIHGKPAKVSSYFRKKANVLQYKHLKTTTEYYKPQFRTENKTVGISQTKPERKNVETKCNAGNVEAKICIITPIPLIKK